MGDWNTGQVTPFAFKRTGDEDYPAHINALVLGPPKSGKTTFISTFPNVVVADVEAGLMSIAHKNVPYVTIDQSEKLKTLLFVLRDEAMRAKAAEQMGLEKIETVAIDTMDALQDKFKKERLATERRTLFEKGDWGWLLDQFRELIRAFVDLPMHVILTCHTKTVEVEEGRTVLVPGLQGGIAEEIAGMVGFSVLMHRTREVDPQTGQPYTAYRLQVEGDDQNPHLGNRAMGRLAGFIEPDFQVLHSAIYDGLALSKQQQGQVDMNASSDGAQLIQEAQNAQPQPEAPQPAPEAAQPAQEAPAQPPSDNDQPVNATALQHVERILGEWGFRLPDTSNWTMGFARDLAGMFIATREDVAKGTTSQEEAKGILKDFLESQGAYVDPDSVPPTEKTIDDLMDWVGDDLDRAKLALDAEKQGKDRNTAKQKLETKIKALSEQPAEPATPSEQPVAEQPVDSQPAPAPTEQAPAQPAPAEAAPAPEPAPAAPAQDQGQEVTDAQAEANIVAGLDAEKISETPAPEQTPEQSNGQGALSRAELMRIEDLDAAPPCQRSGKPVDDLDIAKLALQRLGEWLCVEEYIAASKS